MKVSVYSMNSLVIYAVLSSEFSCTSITSSVAVPAAGSSVALVSGCKSDNKLQIEEKMDYIKPQIRSL